VCLIGGYLINVPHRRVFQIPHLINGGDLSRSELQNGVAVTPPYSCRFGWRWIISILKRIRDKAPATARLVSLNRARRGAYNGIDSVNISGDLVVLQLSWLAGMSVTPSPHEVWYSASIIVEEG
jgi:hypothetical protein